MNVPAPIQGCTITTPRYRAKARVLAESFLERHPGASFSVLAIEDPDREPDRTVPFEMLTPLDVGLDREELNRRATMYLPQGLATSLKPALIATLLARGGGPVLFLDADSCVYDELSHVAELTSAHSVLLSAHAVQPQPLWPLDGPEQIFLRAGVMNAGLIGAGPRATDFLTWWDQRTARHCIHDQDRGLLFEQSWLTLVPALFEHRVLRDRGCNVAGWNLNGSDVEWDGSRPMIDGVPLRHFHFAASYDPERPWQLSGQSHASWWPALEERPGVARLSEEYARRLMAHGHRRDQGDPEPYGMTPSGAALLPWMRTSYHLAVIEAERDGTDEPPNPFSGREDAFWRWLGDSATERTEEALTADGTALGAWSAETRAELVLAMREARDLLARIKELDAAVEDAAGWGERVSSELAQTGRVLAERDRELRRANEVMQATWRSYSWRLTRPLRRAKAWTLRRH